MNLADYLISIGYLKTPIIVEAFKKIKRIDFLPDDIRNLADLDQALPIGNSQTISQPAVVAFMLELLQPREGERILDIGSGSGWTTSLLAYIVSKKKASGKVFAVELIQKLQKLGEKNTKKYNFIEKGVAKFFLGNGWQGLKKEAPFDKILVSAAAESVPLALKKQLKKGGRIVIPVKDKKEDSFFSQSIWLLEKKDDEEFEIKKTPGFVFVPLVDKKKQ